MRVSQRELTKNQATQLIHGSNWAHPLNVGAAFMTMLLAIIGWIRLSAIFSPLIGHFLYLTSHAQLLHAPRACLRAPRSVARRRSMPRHLSANSYSRQTYRQRSAG